MKRTNRWFSWSLVAAVLLVSSIGAGGAQAQANPIAFGVFAGATIPTGDFSDGVDTGWHAGGLLQWDVVGWPIGIRVDAGYHRFSFKGTGDDNFNIVPVTANLVWMFPMDAGATVRPYLIGGVGYYHASCDGCDSDDKFGINGGAGLSVPLTGFSAFAEARFHNIFTEGSSTQMIPISVGIMIRP
jgi:hypothetical protein